MSIDLHQWGNDEVAREILTYLADHPNAQDSFEGIVQWWLLERKIRHQINLVKQVLDNLVKEDQLVEDCGLDNKKRYRINSHNKRKNNQP